MQNMEARCLSGSATWDVANLPLSPLETMPVRLRGRIFRFALAQPDEIVIYPHSNRGIQPLCTTGAEFLALTLMSRTTRQEAQQLFFAENDLIVKLWCCAPAEEDDVENFNEKMRENPPALAHWLKRIPAQQLVQFRSFTVGFGI